MMPQDFGYKTAESYVAFRDNNYYIWDCSVIKAEGKYHMFSSRWEKELGFGWNWLFNSSVIHAVSDKPEGPYTYVNTVLPRRGRQYFDGMNTHNTCIKQYGGKYYLYYMGTSFPGNIPVSADEISFGRGLETWNRKRIGLAVADSINGEFVRRDNPILSPRDCSHWDCTITTNPSAVILPDGKTYMIYKSRSYVDMPLQLGVAAADSPDGIYERICDTPVFDFPDKNMHIEDPFLWYDETRGKFCLIAKDDVKNGAYGITGCWGNGFYAESDDCIHFEIGDNPLVYTRELDWADGHHTVQCNLERPCILFGDDGKPEYLFCASGNGKDPYSFEGVTYIVCTRLTK